MFDSDDLDYTIDEEHLWRPAFDKFYEKSLSDEWMPECIDCMEEEQEPDSRSLRVESLQKYDNADTHGLKYWDLKISNTCNLMCRMCGPNDSSTWMKNAKANPVFDWPEHVKESLTAKLSWHDTFLETVKDSLWDIDVLKFTGGEPMLVKHVKEVIQHLIDQGASKSVSLRLTTNATVVYDEWWQNLVHEFKNVCVSMSIDGYGKRFEYQRAGASWEQVEKNAKLISKQQKHKNFFCNIAYTPTSINAAITDQTRAWAEENNLYFHKGVVVHKPTYMGYASLDYPLRTRYNIQSDVPYDPAQFEILKKQMSYIDKVYNTDFKTECPEFFDK
jgi:MoaA/NifB/PqqE/SkfB family radical SAM enzyme